VAQILTFLAASCAESMPVQWSGTDPKSAATRYSNNKWNISTTRPITAYTHHKCNNGAWTRLRTSCYL